MDNLPVIQTTDKATKQADQQNKKNIDQALDGGMTKLQPVTQYHQRWLQGRQRATIPTVLPQGVCQTVFYINKEGAYRHFTPGLAPKKITKDGPKWGSSAENEMKETIGNPCDSEDEEILIPDALN